MPQNVRKIIFIDLDHTLLDNLDIRLSAARQALRILFPKTAVESALVTYTKIIDHTYAFEALGFPSFSHYWNPLEIYAILALLTNDNNFVKSHPEVATVDAKSIWTDLSAVDRMVCGANRLQYFTDKHFYEAILETLECRDRLKAFATRVRVISSDSIFRKAQQAYDKKLELKPLKDAIHFLRCLQKSDFLFYLVTEGLTNIQLKKVSLLGLAELFNGRILVTQSAAQPVEAEEIFKAAQNLIADRELLLTDDQRCLDYLTLSYFHSFMRRWADKCNKQFYGRVLHAVQLNPSSPQDSLSKVEILNKDDWYSRPPIKLAMIGDRYDKDLLPVLELCGKENSLTIRIRQGKYKSAPHPQQSDTWRSPTVSFEEFSQVQNFILDPKNWGAIGPVPWPKIFDEPPSAQAAIFIERAKKMSIPSVQKLAKILENEQRLSD